jgi:hypothetical protein
MPSRRRTRERRTAAQWTEILQRFELSGLGTREFCHRERLAPSSFQRWRSRLGPVPATEFVELVPTAATSPAASSSWSLDVALPNGVSLRFRG